MPAGLYILLFFSSAVCVKTVEGQDPRCLNEQGEPRSWFFMLKMPNGYDYLYADSQNNLPVRNYTLRPGNYSINDTRNPVARVLQPIYSNNPQQVINFIMYNGEPPATDETDDESTDDQRSYAKGVAIWNKKSALWLIHSVPGFPPRPEDGYSYPRSGRVYGQSFLCVGMDMANLEPLYLIATQLYNIWPKIYRFTVHPKYHVVRRLRQVIHSQHTNTSHAKIQQFQLSELSTPFTAFAKTKDFGNRDLYKEILAPYLKSQFMWVETWRNGNGTPLPSNCTGGTNVNNLTKMTLGDRMYNANQDNSKWAITHNNLLCVADVNRVESQFERGGGAVCFKPPAALMEQMLGGIRGVQPCHAN